MIKVLTFLLADDIRQEQNGKSIIIGVYSGDVLVSRFPADLKVAIWLEIEITDKSMKPTMDLELRMQLVDDSGKKQFESSEPIKFVTPDAALAKVTKIKAGLIINSIPLHANCEGSIVVSLREPNKRWRKIMTKRIGLKIPNS